MNILAKAKNLFGHKTGARSLPFILSCLAILSALSTYAIISYGGVSLAQRSSVITTFIVLDVILIVLLACVIAQKFFWIVREHKKRSLGAHLHMVFVGLFSLVTMTPSIVVAILAVTFFKFGVSVWFSQPVRDMLNDANVVAELYLQEHMRSIRSDAVVIANQIKPLLTEYDPFEQKDQLILQKELDELVDRQNLNEALLFIVNNRTHRPTLIRSSLSFFLELSAAMGISEEDRLALDSNEVIVKENQGFMEAMVPLDAGVQETPVFLWVGKDIESNILKYVTKARDSTKYYNVLLANHQKFLLVLITLFALSSLLLLLASIWVGLVLANDLVEPITKLISAADSVSNGDLTVRITEVSSKNELNHLVQSFNRMTEQLEKQNMDLIISEKKSAWSDIARKIAHEVKNPLTPIQLSAERLKRKYGKEISSDSETFMKCIDTIIRQVSHIENLINEFSAFARMPEPVMCSVDVAQLVRDTVFLQKQAFPGIQYQLEFPQKTVMWTCDANQISQVLSNLLQNAAHAILEEDNNSQGSKLPFGQIHISLVEEIEELVLVVEDNGPGFPKEKRERIFEPYFTTRKNGTGLGMAIVLRIVTEHSGTMELKDALTHQGARVEIRFPKL